MVTTAIERPIDSHRLLPARRLSPRAWEATTPLGQWSWCVAYGRTRRQARSALRRQLSKDAKS